MSASVYRQPPSPPMATNTSPATPLRKWSIDDARASRLYSPASPALYGVDMLGAAPAPSSPSPNNSYAFDDEHAYAYRYSLFDDYAEAADDDLYPHPHALAPMPVASSSKLLLHQAPKPASLSEPVQNFFDLDLDLDPESQIDQPYEYSYEYGVGLARRQFAEKRERRRGGVCEWDFALLDSDHGHGHEQDRLDAAVPDWSPLSDLSLASTNTDSPSADHDPTFGPDLTDSNPDSYPKPSSPSYALRKARTAIGNTDAEEMARAMIGLGLVRPSYRPPSDIDVDADERARESWRELGFGREEEGEDAGGSRRGTGWMWTTEDAPGLQEGNMSFMDTEGTDADVVSHLDLDVDVDDNDDENEDEGGEHDGGEGHGSVDVGAYIHTHTPADTKADTDDGHGAHANRVSPPHSSPPPPPPPLRTAQPSSQHLAIPVPTPAPAPHSQLTLRGTRASALVDWAALALDAALREDPGACWAAVCFGDVFPPPSRPAGSDGGDEGAGMSAGLRQGVELGVGTRGREREMLAFSHALASSELEVREVHSGAGSRPLEAEAQAEEEPEAETSARRASEPDLEPAEPTPAQTTRGRSQRRKQLPPTSPALPTQTQTQTRTRPRIVTNTTTDTTVAAPIPAFIPATTSTPASQTQARQRGRTRTRERTPVDPVLCATPATTPPSSALALVSVSPAGLGSDGMDPGNVPPVPPLPPSASQLLPVNPVVQDDDAPASVAPSLAPATTTSSGIPALRLDTSWSGSAPGSINSIPLPSMGRRVIGSEGDVFSHASASQSPHTLSTDHEGGADAQEVPLPTRNAHDDAIFAALLTPTAPLALSPTRPPAPRYRPLSDPPPYTAAVAGSNTHPHGLARGVSPGPGGSPGVDAEVQQPYQLPPALEAEANPDPDSKAHLRALVQRQERERARAQGTRTARRELPPVPVPARVRSESPVRRTDGVVEGAGGMRINDSASAGQRRGEVETASESGGTVSSVHDTPSLLELDQDSEEGQVQEGEGEQNPRTRPMNWRAYTSCPDLSLEGGRVSEGDESRSSEGGDEATRGLEHSMDEDREHRDIDAGEDADDDERQGEGEGGRDRPFSPFSHISAGAATHAEDTSFSHQPSPASASASAYDSPSTSYMHVHAASGSGAASVFTSPVTTTSSESCSRSAYSGSGSGWHASTSASASASNVSLSGTFAPPPPLPIFSASRPSSPFHKNAIPSAKALSTLGIAPPSGPGLGLGAGSGFTLPAHPSAQSAQAPLGAAPRATQMTFETTYLPNFAVPRAGEGIGYSPKHPAHPSHPKGKALSYNHIHPPLPPTGNSNSKHKYKAKSVGRVGRSAAARHGSRLAGHAKAAKSVDMAAAAESKFGGMWSDPLEAAAEFVESGGGRGGGGGLSAESGSGGAFHRFAGALSRRFATVSIGSGR